MTRLAYICKDRGIPLDGLKGSAIHARSMIRALAECGAEIVVFSPRVGRTGWADGLPIRFVNLSSNWTNGVPEQSSANHNAGEATQKILEECHAQTPFDAVYERLAIMAPGASRWCRRNEVPHWVEVNAPLVKEAMAHRQLLAVEAAEQMEREVLANATLLLPVSPWLRRWLLELGCAGDRVQVLPNGVPDDWLAPDGRRSAGRPTRIGFVGSLRPWHDVKTLIKAMELLPEGEFHLTIAGDGPMRERLGEWLADDALRRRVEWLGARPREEIPALIDQMDICVAPHPAMDDFYFCPIKIFEYGARRRAVIAADLPELRELFPPNALEFYPAGDAPAMAAAIRALADDPSLCDERANVLYYFVSDHTWGRHAAQVLKWGGMQ